MKEMQALVRSYVLNRDRQMKYLAVLIALSLFVSFMVPFILMKPADSMSEAATCGIEEHNHSVEAGCYQLFCTPEEGEEHVHSDLCYGLICEKIVHTHTENCSPNTPDFSALFSVIYDPVNLSNAPNATNYANSPRDRDSEYKAPAGSILGVATHFHIFAESVSLQSHVHGNIATNWLLQNGAFGVYNDRLNGMSSINYIRNLGPNANLDNAYQTQLIMGSNYSSPPSPWFSNRYEIHSKKDRRTYYIPKDKFPAWGADGYVEPQLKFERPDRPYINITKELDRFAEMSLDLVDEAGPVNAGQGVSIKQGYTVVVSDQNGNFANNYNPYANPVKNEIIVKMQGENLTLDFSNVDDKYIYFTIDATKFGMVSPWSTFQRVLHVKGITEDKFLFLNVDVGTNPNAYFNKSWLVYEADDQNSTYGTGEVTLGEGGTRVLYNIVGKDANGNYKPFDGDAVFGERRNGSVLAPNADVNIAGNTNGTIIARNFVATGESHRCDVQQEGTERNDSDWSLEEKPTTPVKPEPKKISVQVEKKWNGTVPNQSIEIELYKAYQANLNVDSLSNPVQTITLNSGNSWKHTFSDLLATEGTNKLYYYVKEKTALYNYTTTYNKNGISESDADKKVVITNTEKKLNVSVVKKWEGTATKPANVQFRLYRSYEPGQNVDVSTNNMTSVGEITLSASNWSGKFENLPVCDSTNGKTFYYYVKEVSQLSDFNTTYSGNGISLNNGTVTVTNTSIEIPTEPPTEPVLVDVSVEKKWKGDVAANQITVGLYKGYAPNQDVNSMSGTPIETYALNSGNNWTHTFKDLRAYDENGNTLYYYIKEETKVPNYSTSYNRNGISVSDGKVTVTNTENTKISVSAQKYWENEQEVVEPTKKTYKIMTIGDSITQGEVGGPNGEVGGGGAHGGYRKYLDYILSDYYKDFFGKEQSYSVDFVGPKNNVNPFDNNGAADEITETFNYNGRNVTFAYDNNHAGYSAHQSYTDNGNSSVYHQLVAADQAENPGSIKLAQPDIVLLMIGTNDKNDNVAPAVYETRMYTLLDYILAELPSNSMLFLASIPEFEWYGTYKDVTDYNKKIRAVAESYANSGKNVRFVDMNAIVKLADLSDKIHPSENGYIKMANNWAEYVDSYISELEPQSITQKSKETSITVNLYKSDNPSLDPTNSEHINQMTLVQENVVLNSANNWKHTFDNLYAKDENNEKTLYYYVVETNVPKNYTVSYQNNAANSQNSTVGVVNTRKELMDINLTKQWIGDRAQIGTKIRVNLYSSETRNLDMTVSDAEFAQMLTDNKLAPVKDDNGNDMFVEFVAGQQASFYDLPVRNAEGKMLYYYVREADVNGYAPTYSKNPVYGGDIDVKITNTKEISIKATKTWSFVNNSQLTSMQNTTVTIELYKYKHIPAEGEMSYIPTTFIPLGAEYVTNKTVTGNNQSVTFDNLPVEEDGYKVFYYVREVPQDAITKDFDVIYGPTESQLTYPAFAEETSDKTIQNKEKDINQISINVFKYWNATDFVVNDKNKDGKVDGTDEYYVQDSVNPVEQWADPIKVTLQYSTDRNNWTDYNRDGVDYRNVEFYDTYTFTGLPKQINGANAYYRVVEAYNYGYVTEYVNNEINAGSYNKGDATPAISLTNTLLKRSLQVKKNWYNNISSGIDKVVVSIYRKTSSLQGADRPDLGIDENNGTYIKPAPTLIVNSFDDNTKQGWSQIGAEANSGIKNNVKYGDAGYSYGLVSEHPQGNANDESTQKYCSYIHKTFTTAEMVPGRAYTISAKATRTSGGAVYMALLVKNGDTLTEIARTPAIDGTGTWQTATGNYTVPENATGTTLIVAPITGDGHMGTMMYVDDIRIELVDEVLIFSEAISDVGVWQPLSAKYGAVDIWSTGAVKVNDANTLGIGGRTDGSTVYEGRVLTTDGAYRPLDSSQFAAGNSYKFKLDVHPRGNADEFVLGLRYTLNGQTYRADMVSAQSEANAWLTLETPAVKIPEGATNVQLCVYSKNNRANFNIANASAHTANNGVTLNAYSEPAAISPSVVHSWTFEDGTSGWEKVDSAAVNVATDFKHGGNQAMTMGGTTGNGVKTSVHLRPGTYKFSAYLARNNWMGTTLQNVQIWVALNDGTEKSVGTCNVTGSWVELTGTFTVTARNTKADLRIAWPGNGSTYISQPIYIDDITLTGPYSTAAAAAKAKPKTAETFFANRGKTKKVTKNTANIMGLTTEKLAKASSNCQDYWYETEIVYSENENKAPTIIDFDTFTRNGNTFIGDTVKHLEVQLYDKVSFPSELNVWLQGSGDFGGSNWKTSSDGLIHAFAKNITISEKTYLRVYTKKPELVKRIVLTFTNGTTLTINNNKAIAEAARVAASVTVEPPAINGNHSVDVQYLDGADWQDAWDIWSSGSDLNTWWAGQKITSADVYFAKDYGVTQDILTADSTAVNTDHSSAEISKFGMYLLVNGAIASNGDRNWNNCEVGTTLESVDLNGNDYHKATYRFDDHDALSSASTNNISSLIIKTGDKLKVRAVVLKCQNGQTCVINNTEYSHILGVTTDTRYTAFTSDVNFDTSTDGDSITSRWPNNDEYLTEVEVYFNKNTVMKSTLSNLFNLSHINTNNVEFDKSSVLYDVATYTVNSNTRPAQNVAFTTKVPNAVKMVVLKSTLGSKFVIVNRTFAENNDYNNTPDKFEKWYPFTLSDLEANYNEEKNEYNPRYNNVFLTIDDLGRDFNGKKIESFQMYINANVTDGTIPGGMATNTYLQDYQVDHEGKLTCTGKVGTSKEACQQVSGALGLCNIYNYDIVNGYDGIANTKFNGANATTMWHGDRLNILTRNPTDIARAVLTFDDGTTYTVWNMNYKAPEEEPSAIHYGHKTSFVDNGTTNLLTGSTTFYRYKDKALDYIVVTYGEDDEKFISIPRDLLDFNGTQGQIQEIGDISVTHELEGSAKGLDSDKKLQDVLKIIEDAGNADLPDDFTMKDIKEVKMFFKDNINGENSTYTITNSTYSPMAPATPPMVGNQPALNGDYVYITDIEITKDASGVWTGDLDGLPVTDGQGNVYEYLVVEKNLYGSGADRYQLISYEHPDGLYLDDDADNDTINTSLLNSNIDDENGPVFMPSSGGEGSKVYYLAGIALMLCGIAGCYGMKRWQRSRR